MHRFLAPLLVLALAVPAVGCGSGGGSNSSGGGGSSSSSSGGGHFARTRFVLHAGLAFGAFHRYIYKPYRQGAFSAGSPRRKRNLAKAALAAGFAYHEIKEARKAADQDGPTLKRLAHPVDTLTGRFGGLQNNLRGGNVAGLGGLNQQISSFSQRSSQDGVHIRERVPPASVVGGG